jgi:hypothetical protein
LIGGDRAAGVCGVEITSPGIEGGGRLQPAADTQPKNGAGRNPSVAQCTRKLNPAPVIDRYPQAMPGISVIDHFDRDNFTVCAAS